MAAPSFRENMNAYMYIPAGQKLKMAGPALPPKPPAEPEVKPQPVAFPPALPPLPVPVRVETTIPALRPRGRPKNAKAANAASTKPKTDKDAKRLALFISQDDYQRISNAAETADMDLELFVQVALKNMILSQEALVGGRGAKKQPFISQRLVAHF